MGKHLTALRRELQQSSFPEFASDKSKGGEDETAFVPSTLKSTYLVKEARLASHIIKIKTKT